MKKVTVLKREIPIAWFIAAAALLVLGIGGFVVYSLCLQAYVAGQGTAEELAKVAQTGVLLYYVGIGLMVAAVVAAVLGFFHNGVKTVLRKIGAAVKERLRKFVVYLKRNPSVIPLLLLLASFLLYSLNLTNLSDTTAKIQGKGMGLCQFCIMLLSMLSMVCLLNAFPRRKKPNIPMIVLAFVMFGVMIYCDIHYCNAILTATTRPENPIIIDEKTLYIASAYNMLQTFVWLIGITAVAVATLPLYSKLLKKINTSVAVEDNGEMEVIEISEA